MTWGIFICLSYQYILFIYSETNLSPTQAFPSINCPKSLPYFRPAPPLRDLRSLSRVGFAYTRKEETHSCERARVVCLPFSLCRAPFLRAKKPQPNSSYVCQTRTSSASPEARTLDTLIKSQVLYQLS